MEKVTKLAMAEAARARGVEKMAEAARARGVEKIVVLVGWRKRIGVEPTNDITAVHWF